VAQPHQAIVAGERAHEAPRSHALDETAFNDVYRRVARPLWAYLRRMTGDAALADDVLQETFTRLLVQSSLPHEEHAQRAWLFRVASNLAIDAMRRAKRTVSADLEPDAEPAAPIQAGRDPILAKEMGRAFAKLDVKERALLWLAYVEAESHRNIAGALGLKESSIRVLLFRARKKLAGIWARRDKERA
jgi:RNA polymerase sigma-70 factor (ECF subfamily)